MDVENQEGSSEAPLYDDIFPALPASEPAPERIINPIPAYKTKTITEVIEIPLEERRYQALTPENLGASEQSKTCASIANALGVKIELANSKNKSLNVIVTGDRTRVASAKQLLMQDLQQQVTRKIKVPIEYHRFLVGRNGDRKRAIEDSTFTKINIPPPAKNSAEITITGSPSKLDNAEKEILKIVEFHIGQSIERLHIPRIYYPFINGPFDATIKALKQKTNTKISFPPYHVQNGDLVISGKSNDVAAAVAEIMNIYKTRLERCTTIPAKIEREKHRQVIGPNAFGLHEILKNTGVSVEAPTTDSDEFTLRGYPEDLGRALTMVFTRVSSTSKEEIVAPNRFHKLLIGKKGTALVTIREGYPSVRVDFARNSDKISVEGPPEEVAEVVNRLKTRIEQLTSSFYLATIQVDSKYYNKLFGSQGQITRLIRVNRYDVRFPSADDVGKLKDESSVHLEGDQFSVECVKSEIERLIKKMENEKTKDLIVEPRIQKLLHQGNPPKIREIEEAFPEMEIHWPEMAVSASGMRNRNITATATNSDRSQSSYIVQICGVRDQVDAAANKLDKLIKQVKEENQEQEVRIFKDCLDRLMGVTIVRLLEETSTRIRYMPPSTDGSVPVVIIGRQENIDTAVQRLEKLQKTLADIKEITIQLPPMLVSKYADSPASRLRSIREQCEGVQLQTKRAHPRQLTISGPLDALEKAKALIESMCLKMAERCSDAIVYADPKFHAHLIGRNGVNLTRFREKNDVEVLFPDRLESDPERASEIHIIGEKDAVAKALKELETTIKTMEDEVDAVVTCDAALIKDLLIQRSAFHYLELERAKIIWPRGFNSPTVRRQHHTEESTNEQDAQEPSGEVSIRIYGAKACVEAAEQRILNMIEDTKAQTTLRHPLTEQSHCQALSRHRSVLPDIQRNYNVLINFQFFNNQRGSNYENLESAAICGHIVLTGREDNIQNVLKCELLPLLPITEEFQFPHEFHGKLFQVDQPLNQNKRNLVPKNNRNARETENNTHTEAPPNKLNELQRKFEVSIQLPPRDQADADHITIRGSADHVENAKAELTNLLNIFKHEKADWLARSYEEKIKVEDRFVLRLLNERDRLYKTYGVAIFVRNPNKNNIPTSNKAVEKEAENKAKDEKVDEMEATDSKPQANGEEATMKVEANNSTVPSTKHLTGYRLLRTTPVIIALQGYKEKVEAARAELDAMLEKFSTFCCEELHIPAKTHARLIGFRRNTIRRLEDEYSVDVEFPPREAKDEIAEIVLVLGAPSDVDAACEELINKANDIVDRLPDKNEHQPSASFNNFPPFQDDFAISGAPWERAAN